MVDSPGFRRGLRKRFADWTRAGRDPDHAPPDDPRSLAEWTAFGHYRKVLEVLGAEDDEGLARWAAMTLRDAPPATLERFTRVRAVEPPPGAAVAIALDGLARGASEMIASIVLDPDRPWLFARNEAMAARLRGRGFDETTVPADPFRLEGLRRCGADLFRNDLAEPIGKLDGVSFHGAPQGAGEALIAARRVSDLLSKGANPSDVVIVATGDPALLAETLARCGVAPASSRLAPLDRDPAIAALVLAMRLPVENWDSESLVRLLRHGQVRPAWPEASAPLSLAAAASAVRESRAYANVSAIRESLRRTSQRTPDPTDDSSGSRSKKADRAASALPIFERLAATIEAAAKPGVWGEQTDRLLGLARGLGLDPEPIERLANALDVHGAIIERLEASRGIWTWRDFTARVRMILKTPVPESTTTAAPRIVGERELGGVEAAHVILVGLGEGAFSPGAMSGDVDARRVAWSAQAANFLRSVDCASETLTLIFPTTDAKGNAVLPCGMLDELRGLFAPDALERATSVLSRLDGVLPESLAMAPPERRVRAVWEACEPGQRAKLFALLTERSHRSALEGTARSLLLAHWRERSTQFHRFDGRLIDAEVIKKLEREHGPEARVYSPSQLESLAFCPFQFYARYILGLEPVESKREFDDDFAGRGSLIHDGLETLHTRIRDIPSPDGATPADRVERAVVAVFDEALGKLREPASPVEAGMMAIEAERLRRIARRYARQFRDYHAKLGQGAEPEKLEVEFGATGGATGPLVIASQEGPIRIRGKIDRIDVAGPDGSRSFRVIDYKSNHVPAASELKTGLALQLPLYVLATERVLFAEAPAAPLDPGYWGLKEKGFSASSPVAKKGKDGFESWQAFTDAMERYVAGLVGRLRRGDFPVKPRAANCEARCDYRNVCRVKQARRTEKAWPDAPTLGGS